MPGVPNRPEPPGAGEFNPKPPIDRFDPVFLSVKPAAMTNLGRGLNGSKIGRPPCREIGVTDLAGSAVIEGSSGSIPDAACPATGTELCARSSGVHPAQTRNARI